MKIFSLSYSYLGEWKLGMQTDRKKAGDGNRAKFIWVKRAILNSKTVGFRRLKKAC